MALRAAIEKVSYAGVTTHFKYTPADHSGQIDVPNPLRVGQYQNGVFKLIDIQN